MQPYGSPFRGQPGSPGPSGPQNKKWESIIQIENKQDVQRPQPIIKSIQNPLHTIDRRNIENYHPNTENMMRNYLYNIEPKYNPVLDIQSQVNLDIFKQNDLYRFYNDKLKKQLEVFEKQKTAPQLIQLYNQDMISQETQFQLDQLLIGVEYAQPLVKKLENQNKQLKTEVKDLSKDLSEFINWVEILLEENKFIRDHINNKNRDIQKLLETIGMNDGEKTHELNHKIHILSEENNILIKHLEDMKKYKDDFDIFCSNKDEELEKARELYEKTREDFDEALKREENISKEALYIQEKSRDQQKMIEELEIENDELKNQINQANNENIKLTNQIKNIKRNFEDFEYKSNTENDKILQEIHFLTNKNRDLDSLLQKIEKENEFLQLENTKQNKSYEKLQQEFDETTKLMKEYKNSFENQKSRFDMAQTREREAREKVIQAENEAEKAILKLQQLEKNFNNLLESSRAEIQEKHQKYEKLIENLRIKHKEDIDDKEQEIEEQMKTIDDQKRLIDGYCLKISDLTKDMKDYKQIKAQLLEQKKLIDFQNEAINRLSSELENSKIENQKIPDLESENKEVKQLLDNLERENQGIIDENNQLQKHINQLKQEINHQIQKIDNLFREKQEMQEQLQLLNSQKNQMSEEKQEREREEEEIDRQLRRLKIENRELDMTNKSLANHIAELNNKIHIMGRSLSPSKLIIHHPPSIPSQVVREPIIREPFIRFNPVTSSNFQEQQERINAIDKNDICNLSNKPYLQRKLTANNTSDELLQ